MRTLLIAFLIIFSIPAGSPDLTVKDSQLDNHAHPDNANIQRCPRCAAPLQTFVVHGHEACAFCKSNIMQCCTGDTCETDHNLAFGYGRSQYEFCNQSIQCF